MFLLRLMDGRFLIPGWIGWIGMALRALIAIALVVLVIVLIVRVLSPRRPGPHGPAEPPPPPSVEGALRILNERFARGEIDEETFRKMRDELRKP